MSFKDDLWPPHAHAHTCPNFQPHTYPTHLVKHAQKEAGEWLGEYERELPLEMSEFSSEQQARWLTSTPNFPPRDPLSLQ